MAELVCDTCGQRFDDHPHDFLVHSCVTRGPRTRVKVWRADGTVEYHDPTEHVVLGPQDRFHVEAVPEEGGDADGGRA